MQDQELHAMPDDVLRARIRELATSERCMTGNLLRHLGEYDARGLYEKDGCQNLWTYCWRVLRFAENEIGLRIQAAKAVHANPELVAMLERGELNLTSIGRLAPHLTGERAKPLIEQAKGLSSTEVRWLVATEKATEKLEAAKAQAAAQATVQSGLFDAGSAPKVDEARVRAELYQDYDRIVPLSGEQARLEAVVSRALVNKIERARMLLAPKFPTGKLEPLLDLALELLLEREDPDRREARRQARAAKRGAEPPDTSRGRRVACATVSCGATAIAASPSRPTAPAASRASSSSSATANLSLSAARRPARTWKRPAIDTTPRPRSMPSVRSGSSPRSRRAARGKSPVTRWPELRRRRLASASAASALIASLGHHPGPRMNDDSTATAARTSSPSRSTDFWFDPTATDNGEEDGLRR